MHRFEWQRLCSITVRVEDKYSLTLALPDQFKVLPRRVRDQIRLDVVGHSQNRTPYSTMPASDFPIDTAQIVALFMESVFYGNLPTIFSASKPNCSVPRCISDHICVVYTVDPVATALHKLQYASRCRAHVCTWNDGPCFWSTSQSRRLRIFQRKRECGILWYKILGECHENGHLCFSDVRRGHYPGLSIHFNFSGLLWSAV